MILCQLISINAFLLVIEIKIALFLIFPMKIAGSVENGSLLRQSIWTARAMTSVTLIILNHCKLIASILFILRIIFRPFEVPLRKMERFISTLALINVEPSLNKPKMVISPFTMSLLSRNITQVSLRFAPNRSISVQMFNIGLFSYRHLYVELEDRNSHDLYIWR